MIGPPPYPASVRISPLPCLESLEPRLLLSADLGLVRDGLTAGLFGDLQDELNDRVLDAEVPLVGRGLISHPAGQMLARVDEALAGFDPGEAPDVEAVRVALAEALGPRIVPSPTGHPIRVFGQNGDSEIRFRMTLGGTETGAADLDLALGENAFLRPLIDIGDAVSFTIDWSMPITIGVRDTGGVSEFFVDLAASEDFAATLTATMDPALSAVGRMGVFSALMTADAARASQFVGAYSVDFLDAGGDGLLTPGEFASVSADGRLTGAGEARLDIDGAFVPDLFAWSGGEVDGLSESDRRFLFNLAVVTDAAIEYSYSDADTAASIVGDDPRIRFENVRLDTAEFFGGFFAPAIEAMRPVFGQLKPVFDILQEPIPGISDLSEAVGQGPITMLDFAAAVTPVGDALRVLDLVNTLVTADTSGMGATGLETVGSFSVTGHKDTGGYPEIDDEDTADELDDKLMSKSELAVDLGASLSFPILEDPTNIFGLMTGEADVSMFGFGVDFGIGFEYGINIPTPIPGLSATIDFAMGAELDFDFGYDTLGVRRLNQALDYTSFDTLQGSLFGAKDLLREGFYFDDHNETGATDGDLVEPSLTVGGVFTEDPPDRDRPELKIYATLSAGAAIGVDLYIIKAEAGVRMPFTLDILFDLNDLPQPLPRDQWRDPAGEPGVRYMYPENESDFEYDGRVRLSEMDMIVESEPLGLFNAQGELSAAVQAYVYAAIDLFFFDITLVDESWNLVSFTLFSFDIYTPPADGDVLSAISPRDPKMAGFLDPAGDPGTLTLYMGPYAGLRQDTSLYSLGGDPGRTDERFAIASEGSTDPDRPELGETIAVTYQNTFTQTFENVHRIEGWGGSDDDSVYVDSGVAAGVELHGGAGDDRLTARGSGVATLYGDDGSDALRGGLGNDRLYGGAGIDELYGGEGDDRLDGGADADVLWGESGDDTLLGGAGVDKLHGGAGVDELRGGGGSDVYTWHVGDGNDRLIEIGGEGLADKLLVGGGQAIVGSSGGRSLYREADDVVRLTESATTPGAVTLQGDGQSLTFAHIEEVTVNAGGGSDRVTIDDLTGTHVEKLTIDLESAGGSDDATDGDIVEFLGSDGPDRLRVERLTGPIPVTDLSETPPLVSYVPQNAVVARETTTGSAVTILGGNPDRDRLILRGRGGDDDLAVVTSGGVHVHDLIAVTLDGGAGDDRLETFYGDTHVVGSDGDDVLVVTDPVSDSASAGPMPSMRLGSDRIVTTRGGGQPTIVSFAGVESLEVKLGSAVSGNDVTVTGAPQGFTRLWGSGGDDRVTVRSLGGPLAIDGGGHGSSGDRVIADFSDNVNGLEGSICPMGIEGFGLTEHLYLSDIEALDVNLGMGNDRIAIDGTEAVTTVSGAAGDDIVTVYGVDSPTFVYGGTVAGQPAGLGDDDTVRLVVRGDANRWGASRFADLGLAVETLHVENAGTAETHWRVEDDAVWVDRDAGRLKLVDTLGTDWIVMTGSAAGADRLTVADHAADPQQVAIDEESVTFEHGVEVLTQTGYLDGPSRARSAMVSPDGQYVYALGFETLGDTALDIYRRDATTGALTPEQSIGETWWLRQEIVPESGAWSSTIEPGDIDIDGNLAVVGVPGPTVYKFGGVSAVEQASIAGVATVSQEFGLPGDYFGESRIFEHSSSGWRDAGKLPPPDPVYLLGADIDYRAYQWFISPQDPWLFGPTYTGSSQAIKGWWEYGAPSNTSTDRFYVRWDGSFVVNAPTPIPVTFYLGCDDGGRLWIDGQLRIDDWSAHGYRTSVGGATLSPGVHTIRVDYFENTGWSAVKLEYSTPGVSPRMLDVSHGSGFGKAVAIAGDVVVMGASGDDAFDIDAGAAHIYHRDSRGDWQYADAIFGEAASDRAGFSVDTDGRWAVGGAVSRIDGRGRVCLRGCRRDRV